MTFFFFLGGGGAECYEVTWIPLEYEFSETVVAGVCLSTCRFQPELNTCRQNWRIEGEDMPVASRGVTFSGLEKKVIIPLA